MPRNRREEAPAEPWKSFLEDLDAKLDGPVDLHCIGGFVQVANYPGRYETRLIRAFPLWNNVRLWALEPHDLALTKLERSFRTRHSGRDVLGGGGIH